MATPTYVNITLPIDRNGREVQVLKGSGTRVNLTAGVASSNTTIPSGAQVVFVRCTDHIWLNWGTAGVTASAANTSLLHPAGESVQIIPAGTTHVAVLRVGAADVPVQLERCDG